jgi:hypothetical protein
MGKFEKGNKLGKGRPKGSTNRKKIIYKSLYEDIVGSFKSGSYYVYYHVENNIVIYIGKGSNDRAWNFRGRPYNEVDVKLICHNLSEEEALAIEKELIKIHKPFYNINYAI